MTAVLYRDPFLIVAVKPAGVLSEDAPGGMPSLIRAAIGEPGAYVGTVHRLDRETAGVMVYALRKETAGRLSEALAAPGAGKRYAAVLRGVPAEPAGTLFDLLYHDKRTNKSFAVSRRRAGVREARLTYRTVTVERTPEGPRTLVSVTLGTGRTHQIRAQFASRGLPLVGDARYGGGRGTPALCAVGLTFLHPETGERMSFSYRPEGGVLGGILLPEADFPGPDE